MYAFRGYDDVSRVIVEKDNFPTLPAKSRESDLVITYADEILNIYSERHGFSERYWIPEFEKYQVISHSILRLPTDYKIAIMLQHHDVNGEVNNDGFIIIDTAKDCYYYYQLPVASYGHQFPVCISIFPDRVMTCFDYDDFQGYGNLHSVIYCFSEQLSTFNKRYHNQLFHCECYPLINAEIKKSAAMLRS